MTCNATIQRFAKGQVCDIPFLWIEDGQPIDLTDCTLTSQMRDADDNLIADLVVTKLDQITNTGRFTVAIDSSDYPLGTLQFNVRFEFNGGKIVHSPTAYLQVVNPPTRSEP